MEYTLVKQGGSDDLKVKRVANDKVEIRIGDKKVLCFTEDLAALVRDCLPEDRAQELFSEIEDKMISQGKMRVIVKAQKDLKQGEPVAFTVNVNRYLDKYQNPIGVRSLPNGFIF